LRIYMAGMGDGFADFDIRGCCCFTR
jgi:hypothetical protein